MKKEGEVEKEHKNILLIEENAKSRQELSSRLRLQGISVEAAISAFHSLSLIELHVYDLVIVVGNMNDMSAVEIISLIRDQFPKIPIIFLSISSEEDIKVEDASSLGISVYGEKSENFNVILGHIKKFLSIKT